VKTSAPQRQQVSTPSNCSGSLRQCLARDPKLTEAKWHRGQMRGYAGFWRRRRDIAALTGCSVESVSETDLFLAKLYRDHAIKLEVAS
jgi:hypothetical protein